MMCTSLQCVITITFSLIATQQYIFSH